MKLILAIIAFNFILIVHELGHFVVARMAKIKVHEFSIFIGPKIFGFKRGDTMYSLRSIPMLAYVKLEGEDEESESENSFGKKSKLVRAAVLAAGPFANLLAAAILLAVVFSISGYNTTKLDAVPKDTPAAVSGIKAGDTLISYNGNRVYQPMDVGMFLYNESKGKTVKIEVARNGEIIPLSFTPKVIPANRYIIGFSPKDNLGETTNVIDSLTPDGPGLKSGLKANDRIIRLDNTDITNYMQIVDFMANNKGEMVRIGVSRGGSELYFDVVPKQQKNLEMYLTGFDFKAEHGNIFEVVKQSAVFTYSMTRVGVYSLVWLIQGKVPLNQMTGAVGVVDAINSIVQKSPTALAVLLDLMQVTALISVAIGVTNLFPIPPADGSKLLLIAVESVRRKPLSREKENFIMLAGFIFMILIFVFTLYNDIARIVTGGG